MVLQIMNNIIVDLYSRLVGFADLLRSPFLLAIRVYWGWQFAQSGWGKFHRMPQVIEFFSGLGIPLPAFNAYVTRCQSILQSGTPANDVLLYVGFHDFWQSADGQLKVFKMPGSWMEGHPVHVEVLRICRDDADDPAT